MAPVFWNSSGILLIDYPAKSQTVMEVYYTGLLDKLDGKIKKTQN